jgi:hypothetical protein
MTSAARTPPTPEEIARQLIRILVFRLGLKPNDEIHDRAMRSEYEARGGKADEIAAGLRFAHENGWVRYERSTDRFYLVAGRDVLPERSPPKGPKV